VKNGRSAPLEEINRAYRKTSIRLHPDKFELPKNKKLTKAQEAAERKKANERFQRLGLIAKILRGEQRARYDHFLKNGFPKWRSTGYYYARFRPGLSAVLFGLYLAAGVTHYVVLILSQRRQKDYMLDVIKEVRKTAFGSSGVPGLEKALQGSEDSGADVSASLTRRERRAKKGKSDVDSGSDTPLKKMQKKKVIAPNGKSFLVDNNGDVYLLDETEDGVQELLLDPNEFKGAKWSNTLLVGIPRGLWRITLGRFIGGNKVEDVYIDSEGEETKTDMKGENVRKTTKRRGAPIARSSDGAPRRRTKTRVAGKAQL
jgi:curved DNA-binding protein CbpA